MYQINNEKFGQFLAEVRKEKQMTQKDLADKLFVSDKTVSKWGTWKQYAKCYITYPYC